MPSTVVRICKIIYSYKYMHDVTNSFSPYFVCIFFSYLCCILFQIRDQVSTLFSICPFLIFPFLEQFAGLLEQQKEILCCLTRFSKLGGRR